jgi:hypothetical protein
MPSCVGPFFDAFLRASRKCFNSFRADFCVEICSVSDSRSYFTQLKTSFSVRNARPGLTRRRGAIRALLARTTARNVYPPLNVHENQRYQLIHNAGISRLASGPSPQQLFLLRFSIILYALKPDSGVFLISFCAVEQPEMR